MKEICIGDVVSYLDCYDDVCIGKVTVELDEENEVRISDPRHGNVWIKSFNVQKIYNTEELVVFEAAHFMNGDQVSFVCEEEVLTGIVNKIESDSIQVILADGQFTRVFYEEVLSVGDDEKDKEGLIIELEHMNTKRWNLYMIDVALDTGDDKLFLAMTKELQAM